jgi:hypothetical protein
MRSFFSKIKVANDCIDFTFITGVTKFARTGVFSQLNTVTDISLEERFGAIVGFTREEIESNFCHHIGNLALKLGTGVPDLM